MNKLDFYKSFYDRENERRETLNNSVSIPVGLLTGLIAATAFLTTSYNYKESLFWTWTFAILIFLNVIFIVISIVYLVKSFNNFTRGHDYMEVSLKADMEKYHADLRHHHNDLEKADQEFTEYLKSDFIKYADRNTSINDKRSFDLFRSKQMLIYSIVAIALACIPFGIGTYMGPEKVAKVQVEGIILNSVVDSKIDSILDIKLYKLQNERKAKAKTDTTNAANRKISER